MIWLCAMHKIDHYVLAVAPLDARGNVGKVRLFQSDDAHAAVVPRLSLAWPMNRASPHVMRPSRCGAILPSATRNAEAARLAAKRKSHPALLATLRCFSAAQLTYDLYEEDEPCDKPLVFAFEGTTLKDEKSGHVFPSPEEAAAFAKTVCPPTLWVETAGRQTG